MKVAIYCRTSKRDQNPENQKLQLIERATKSGWEYEVFEEQESTRNTRPIKQEVLTQLRKGKFDGVLIWKLDRWARSLQELIMDIDELTSKNKEFMVQTQPIDTTSASGRLFMQILGAFAEFEREIIRERTMAGLDRARAQGRTLGRPKGMGKPIPKLSMVNELLAKGNDERTIAKLLETSRYKVQKAIEEIKKINPSKTEGVLNDSHLG